MALGNATPQTLVDTMVYMNGFYFALQSGKEHGQLRSTPCQFELTLAFRRATRSMEKLQHVQPFLATI